MIKKLFTLSLFSFFSLHGQGLIGTLLQEQQANQAVHSEHTVHCGSHFLSLQQDQLTPGYLDASNEALRQTVSNLGAIQKTTNATIAVPVVFHIVYNDSTENLPDSVIQHQLLSLNNNFGRRNADTTSLRSVFQPYVGNPNIQFELASIDPDGNPTTGIVRKSTSIGYFGGVLPYGPNQTAQIQQWAQDSLFYNLSRISVDSLGGSSPWDIDRYLNIWVGDLRIFEPLFNNFEELVFLGYAMPKPGHPNFAGTGIDSLLTYPGAIMHYVAIGPNNPNSFPPPYGNFNTISSEGDLLSHEVGHFLGLRHIWGDGDCTADDFINDTPLSNNSNQFSCNKQRNTCLDSIGGVNLPDMVENFMDYSSDVCMNTFTLEQALVMRTTLMVFFPGIYAVGTEEPAELPEIKCFPNPTTGTLRLEAGVSWQGARVQVLNTTGLEVLTTEMSNEGTLNLEIEGPSGIYFVRVIGKQTERTFKVLKN